MFRLSHFVTAVLVACAALFASACQSLPSIGSRSVTRAMWVTRFDYKTRADIERIAEACDLAGINTILFQVRGNATAFYRSSYEPWAEQFNHADPGFDPLAVMIDEGHARGLDVHAWVNVVPAWWGLTPPKSPKQIYNARPEWLWYDQAGNRQALSKDFYVSLNPCLPEVRRYIVEVLRDIVGRYSIDGLHLDYLRFPNEDPATPAGSGLDYPRDAKTLALFQAESGATPQIDPAAWNRWRAEQITNLLRDIRYMVSHAKSGLELSAAVGAVPEAALGHHQDVRTWMDAKLLDAVYPMNYSADLDTFMGRAAAWKEIADGVPVVMGINIDPGKVEATRSIDVVREQIFQSLKMFNGYAVFAYSLMFDSANTTIAAQDENTQFRRQMWRKALLPILQEMSKSGAGQAR